MQPSVHQSNIEELWIRLCSYLPKFTNVSVQRNSLAKSAILSVACCCCVERDLATNGYLE